MKICMLLHKSVEHDSRVRREGKALARAGHEVTVVHLPRVAGELNGELDGFRVVSATPPAWVRERIPFALYRIVFLAAFVRSVLRERPDAVHAHDAAMLVPGWLAARRARARLIYDTHEYAPGVPYRDRAWALFVKAVERTFISRCDAVITVSDGIADRLQERYRLGERPTLVRNVPDLEMYDSDFEAPDLRAQLRMEADAPLVLHLGAVARDRGCETLVRAMGEVDEPAELLFLGADDGAYVEGLRAVAAAEGVAQRIHFRPSVPVEHVLAYVRQASVGVSLLEDTCENHRLALPNKVFEYLAAGVGVVVSDLPEVGRLLGDMSYTGRVDARDPRLLAEKLNALVLDRTDRRRTQLSWMQEAARLTDLYRTHDASSALLIVRNTCRHDARVLRSAKVLEQMGFDTRVLAVVSSTDREPTIHIDGVRIDRLEPRSPFARARHKLTASSETDREGRPVTAPLAGARNTPGVPGALIGLHRWLTTLDYYRQAIGSVRRTRPTLVHCNDYNTLWVGAVARLVTGARLVYDAHELWPDRNQRPEPRWWLLACEALLVRLANRSITTSPAYAECIARRYRVGRPEVIRNIPTLPFNGDSLAAGPRFGRAVVRRAVYFGAVTRNRGLEQAIEALVHVPDVDLRIVGPDTAGHGSELGALARRLGIADRVDILPPVPPAAAGRVLHDGAVGLALIQPACLSYRLTLPNKLFEYVSAGLPILGSDLPEIAAFITRHGVGLTVAPNDPRAIAAALDQMLETAPNRGFAAAARKARAELNWTAESRKLARVYAEATAT